MSVFHSPEFVRLNGLKLIDAERLVGTTEPCSLLLGPEMGTYGGFSCVTSIDRMEGLLLYAPRECLVKLAPAGHDLQLFSLSLNVLNRAGFCLEHSELNYEREIGPEFESLLSSGARKKLAKCEREGFRSVKLETRLEWWLAYRLIEINRERQGVSLSVPFGSIEKMEQALPGTYVFFGTYDDKRLVAAAITVRVRSDILYIYAWGDAEQTEFSPTTHLCGEIYRYASLNGYRMLDAGISTLRAVPNKGLIAYKESLGFKPSVKVTMVRHA